MRPPAPRRRQRGRSPASPRLRGVEETREYEVTLVRRRREGTDEPAREHRVRVPEGGLLIEAAVRAGLPIAQACGGKSLCARCGLEILAGADGLSPEEAHEVRAKERNRIPASLRLACRARVGGDVRATAGYW